MTGWKKQPMNESMYLLLKMVIFPLSFGYRSHTYRASSSWLKDWCCFDPTLTCFDWVILLKRGGKSFISRETSLRFWNFHELTKVVFNKRTSSRPKTAADETVLLLEFVIWPLKTFKTLTVLFSSLSANPSFTCNVHFFSSFFLRPRNPYRLHWKYFRACDFFGKSSGRWTKKTHFYTKPVVHILLMVDFFRCEPI